MKDAVLLVLAVVWTVGWASRAVVEVSNDRPWWSVYSGVLFVAGVGWWQHACVASVSGPQRPTRVAGKCR